MDSTEKARQEYERIHTHPEDRYTDEDLKLLVCNFLRDHAGQGYTYNEVAQEFGTVFAQAGRVLAFLTKEKTDIVYYAAADDKKGGKAKLGTKRKLYWWSPLRATWERAGSVAARQKVVQDAIHQFVWENEGCSESAIRSEMLRLFVHLSVDTIRAAIKALDDGEKIVRCAALVETAAGKRYGTIYTIK